MAQQYMTFVETRIPHRMDIVHVPLQRQHHSTQLGRRSGYAITGTVNMSALTMASIAILGCANGTSGIRMLLDYQIPNWLSDDRLYRASMRKGQVKPRKGLGYGPS